jgi:hypothetical protein
MSAFERIADIHQTKEMPNQHFETLIIKGCRAIKGGSEGVVPDQYFYTLETAVVRERLLSFSEKNFRKVPFVL